MHVHCHHRTIMKIDAKEAVLRRLGLDYRIPDAGCCGLAGSFGFERERYAVSMKIGEPSLLQAVRQADAQTLVIANGFSCREQIRHATGRQPLHLAEVLALALNQETASVPTGSGKDG